MNTRLRKLAIQKIIGILLIVFYIVVSRTLKEDGAIIFLFIGLPLVFINKQLDKGLK